VSETADAFVPLTFAPGEAYQFDWSHEIFVMDGLTTIVKVAHLRLCHSRIVFMRTYPALELAGRGADEGVDHQLAVHFVHPGFAPQQVRRDHYLWGTRRDVIGGDASLAPDKKINDVSTVVTVAALSGAISALRSPRIRGRRSASPHSLDNLATTSVRRALSVCSTRTRRWSRSSTC
jgi:hypothetical protein